MDDLLSDMFNVAVSFTNEIGSISVKYTQHFLARILKHWVLGSKNPKVRKILNTNKRRTIVR